MKALLLLAIVFVSVHECLAVKSPAEQLLREPGADHATPDWRSALAAAVCEDGAAAPRLLVLASPGAPPPRRRADGEPAVSAPGGAPGSAAAALALANRALLAAEASLPSGRRLFPIRVRFAPVRAAAAAAAAGCAPRGGTGAGAGGGAGGSPVGAPATWAVFDASAAEYVVDDSALGLLQSALAPPEHAAAAARLAAAVADALAASAQQAAASAASAVSSSAPLAALAAAAAAAVPAALAAGAAGAGAAPPVWFCIACVAAMGLLCPLVINYLIGEAANIACERLKLDTQACLDLFVGALAVALVLSLLSSVPIYKVCRLYECAHRNGTDTRRPAAT